MFQRLEQPKWKARMKAYKEVNELFYHQYSKDCQRADFGDNPLNADEEDEGKPNAFDLYGPLLQKIIGDSNLIAQYEGLSCLHTYVRYAPEIKSVVFMVHGILLDKI